LPQQGITVATKGDKVEIRLPSGDVMSRYYAVNGEAVHEVVFGDSHMTRGAQPSAVDPAVPSTLQGSLACEVDPKDASRLLVRTSHGKPLGLQRQTGAPSVPLNPGEIAAATKLMETLARGILLGQNPLVEGPPGVGKSHACKYLAHKLGYNYHHLQVTPFIEEDSVAGTYRPVKMDDGNGGTIVVPEYVYSIFHAAATESQTHHTIVNLDELNKAQSQGVFAALYPLLASGELPGAYLPSGKREWVTANMANLHIFATQNPSRKNDPDNLYDNVDLDDALSDRFPNVATLGWPTVDEQVEILRVMVPNCDPSFALKVSNLAFKMRTTMDRANGLPVNLGSRRVAALVHDVTTFGADKHNLERAYVSKFEDWLPKASPSLIAAVRQYAKAEGVIA
jgi:MoxR-like ATPase